jgi:hypothetical protein
MTCTCPLKTLDGATVPAGLDRLCPLHGQKRGQMKSREQMILESLRDDLTAQSSRNLTAKEQQFVGECKQHEFTVLYDRKGKPYAWGAPNNRYLFSGTVSSRAWQFDTQKPKSHFYWLA